MKSDHFRTHHLLAMLKGFEEQGLPLDAFLMEYCRQHKALGSKDRKFIVDNVYGLIRWRGLLDHLLNHSPSWVDRWELYRTIDPLSFAAREDLPAHIRCSFPRKLFELLATDYGNEEACRLALASNTVAPTTVRANRLKTSRSALMDRLQAHCEVKPCSQAPFGIQFGQRHNFRILPEFRDGLFEVQDEGSQLVAGLVEAKPGDTVLDFCAGSGGKSLAIAVGMENRGQLFLHDIRQRALEEARKRLKRAGVQNAQVILDNSPKLTKLKKSCDWVLVDAPCSGTGTLRRNPDMKWRFEAEWIGKLRGEQRVIFERALSYVKPKGRIVYATCSLLKEENEHQAEHFANTYHLEQLGPAFKSFPTPGSMDGFYAVVFRG